MSKIKEINPSDAVLCWVGDSEEEFESKKLIKQILCFFNVENRTYKYVDTNGNWWKYAEPVEQEKERGITITKAYEKWSDKYPNDWSIDAKIFKAISEGAVLRNKNIKIPFTWWNQIELENLYQICTNYTGKDTDKWEEII